MKKAFAALTATTAILCLAIGVAFAAPHVEMKIKAEKEKVVTKDGKKVTKMVAAKEIVPGDVIHYSILYRNTGSDDATSVVLTDPIPEGTAYIPGSATDIGEITFSIDKGKTYKKQALLTYEVKRPQGGVEKRTASPEEYTNIRWVIDRIPAGSNGKVTFQVRVK